MNKKSSRGPKKKIIRVSEEYGLEGIGAEMASMWTHPDEDERYTLEELRDYFNKHVLEAAVKGAGIDAMPGFVDGAYKGLFYNDDPIEEKEIKLAFKRHNVDVDEIMDDFISSQQTIHNYLIEVEDVELHPEKRPKEKKEKSLGYLRSLDKRYENVVSDIIERLVNEEELFNGDYEVHVECFVENKETGEERHIEDILQSEI